MSGDARFFRESLVRLSQAPTAFMQSDDFLGFVDLLKRRTAPAARAYAGSWGRPFSDLDDAVHELVVALIDNAGKHQNIIDAIDPFSYLATTVKGWLAETLNVVDTDGHLAAGFAGLEGEAETVPALASADSGVFGYVGENGARFAEAVRMTVETLSPRTPQHLLGELGELVQWMADNPVVRRGHEAESLAWAFEDFPTAERRTITSVAAVTWGTRANPRGTSVLGGYLCDRNFRPRSSASHLLALRKYQASLARS